MKNYVIKFPRFSFIFFAFSINHSTSFFVLSEYLYPKSLIVYSILYIYNSNPLLRNIYSNLAVSSGI